MSLSNCACVISTLPTSAMFPSPTSPPPPPPPQAASASTSAARGIRKKKRLCLMEKAPSAADASRCLARLQYSIDERQRGGEPVAVLSAFFPERNLALRGRVNRRLDASAKVAELLRAEHERPDGCAPVSENEVVGADARELELGLLDAEQVLDRLGDRPVAILGRGVQLDQLVLRLGQRDAAMKVDLERLGRDVGGRDVGVDLRVDADRPRGWAALAGELRDRF